MIIFDVFKGVIPEQIAAGTNKINSVNSRNYGQFVARATGNIKITGDMLKPGAVLIDIGMQRDEQGDLCGDCDFKSCTSAVGYITPTPGGTGPMTTLV